MEPSAIILFLKLKITRIGGFGGSKACCTQNLLRIRRFSLKTKPQLTCFSNTPAKRYHFQAKCCLTNFIFDQKPLFLTNGQK